MDGEKSIKEVVGSKTNLYEINYKKINLKITILIIKNGNSKTRNSYFSKS